MSKWIKISLYSLLSIIAILLLALMLLATTNWGIRCGFRLSQILIPGQLSYATISGTLIRGINISQLSYQNNTSKLTINNFYTKTSLLPIFAGHLVIKKLIINDINYVSHHTDNASQSNNNIKTTKTKNFGLPLTISIHHAQIHNLTIQKQYFKNVSFSGTIGRQKLTVNSLIFSNNIYYKNLISKSYTLLTPHHNTNTGTKKNMGLQSYTVRIVGNNKFHIPYTMNWKADINGQLANGQTINAKLTLNGNSKLATLKAKINSPFTSQWQGKFQQWLSTNGSIELNGSWQQFNWSTKKNKITSPQGKLKIQGKFNHYLLLLTTKLGGNLIPASTWQIQAQGNTQQLQFKHINIQTLGGVLLAQGNLQWRPYLQWQFNMSGNNINPGKKWHNWQGQLNFTTALSGHYKNQQWQTDWQTSQINGKLNKQAVSGSWQINIKPNNLIINHAKLSIGKNYLHVAGNLNQKWKLQWQIEAPQLHTISTDLQGQLSSTGIVSGNKNHPQITAKAYAEKLSVSQFNIKNLKANININAKNNGELNLSIAAQKIHFKQHNIHRFNLNSQGTIQQQSWQILLNTSLFYISAHANGNIKNNAWQGQLTQFKVSQKDTTSSLQLQSANNISISKQQVIISPFCLNSQQHQQLCGQLQWQQNQNFSAKLTLQNINLNLINNWLPNTITLDAPVDGNITIRKSSINSIVIGKAKITLPYLKLYQTGKKVTVLDIKNLRLNALLNQQGLTASANIKNNIILQASLNAPDINSSILLNSQQLQGQLNFNIPDLTFASSLSNDLENTQGQFKGQLKLNGTIGNPDLSGLLMLNNGKAKIVPLNINAQKINVKANFTNQHKVLLTGNLYVDKGNLNLDGYTHWLAPFDSNIKITSNKLLAINTPEYKVYANADLALKYHQPVVTLTGKLTIPQATIKPKNFSSITTLPDNIIYTHQQEQKATNINIDLQTILQNIKFIYMGLNATLQGKMKIKKTPQTLFTATGQLSTKKGSNYKAYGQDLTIEKGNLFFAGGPIDNPGLDIRAVRYIQTTAVTQGLTTIPNSVGTQITGSLKAPTLTLFANPNTFDQTTILSYLLFGHGSSRTNATQREKLLLAASSGLTHTNFAQSVQKKLGISSLEFESNQYLDKDNELTQNTSLIIGKQITPHLLARYSIGLLKPVDILQLIYQINQHLRLQTNSSQIDNGADIIYIIQTD